MNYHNIFIKFRPISITIYFVNKTTQQNRPTTISSMTELRPFTVSQMYVPASVNLSRFVWRSYCSVCVVSTWNPMNLGDILWPFDTRTGSIPLIDLYFQRGADMLFGSVHGMEAGWSTTATNTEDLVSILPHCTAFPIALYIVILMMWK